MQSSCPLDVKSKSEVVFGFQDVFGRPQKGLSQSQGVSHKSYLEPDSDTALQNLAVLVDYDAVFLRATCKV